MKTAHLGSSTSFSKGKIIVHGNNSSTHNGITALKSKFANPSIYHDPSSLPSFQQVDKSTNAQTNTENTESSEDEEEEVISSSRFHNVQSTINTTNSSLNTTFSGFYHKLIGRERRRPQCTPPIRTVISVGFLKEHFENQVELEKQRQSFSSSKSNHQPQQDEILDTTSKKQEQEKQSTKPKVSWEDDPPINNNTSRRNQMNDMKKSQPLNVLESDSNGDMDRKAISWSSNEISVY